MAGPGRYRMERAATIVALQAIELSARWSVTVPPSVKVRVTSDSTATITSAAPAAYPNEITRCRHPVFGPTLRNPRPAWVTNQHRPFLAPAADAKADAAANEIAKSIDDLCHDLGYENK